MNQALELWLRRLSDVCSATADWADAALKRPPRWQLEQDCDTAQQSLAEQVAGYRADLQEIKEDLNEMRIERDSAVEEADRSRARVAALEKEQRRVNPWAEARRLCFDPTLTDEAEAPGPALGAPERRGPGDSERSFVWTPQSADAER